MSLHECSCSKENPVDDNGKRYQACFYAVPLEMAILSDKLEIIETNDFFRQRMSLQSDDLPIASFLCQVLGCGGSGEEPDGNTGPLLCKGCALRSALESVVAERKSVRDLIMSMWLPRQIGKVRADKRDKSDKVLPVAAKLTAGRETAIEDQAKATKAELVRVWFKINVNPVAWDDQYRALLTIENIDKYKRVVDNLTSSRDFFLSLFDNFPAMIWRSGLDQQWDYFSKSWLKFTGRALEEETGTGWLQGMHPEDRKQYQEAYQACFVQQQDFELEYRLRRWDGEYRWVLDVGKPFQDMEGTFDGFVGAVIDITERKKTEEERKQTELALKYAVEAVNAAYRAKSDFLANMSHEIRTPLNGIIGMVDLTLQSELDEDLRENLSIAKTCADSLLRIINDILDFSKLEAGKVAIEKVEFNLRELIEKTGKVHMSRLAAKGLELYYQMSASLPVRVIGDPYRLQQVLNNLLGNAVKFTEQGNIVISVKILEQVEHSCVLQFAVADTGLGIPSEKSELIFQSFSQVDNSHTRKYGGTGLGLAISKQLVELMGGQIRVENNPAGGSIFIFTISCKLAATGKAAAAGAAADESLHINHVMHLLLAEDNRENQIVLGMMLKKLGHTYQLANNGSEALKLWAEQKFDVILMDIQMPELDGLEATRLIREQEKGTGKRVPIIAVTAHALMGDRERFLALGMDDYIAKPVIIEKLHACLERVADRESGGIYQMPESGLSAQALEQLSAGFAAMLADISFQTELLEAILEDSNLPIAEVVADAIRSLALENSLDSVKDQAFQITLAARRGDLAEARHVYQELNNNIKNLKVIFHSDQQADGVWPV